MFMYLKPLGRIFQQIEELELDKISIYFGPLFHILALSWSKSRIFRNPSRFILLLQKISSALIVQTKQYLDSTELLKGEPQESIDKVAFALKVLDAFMEQFKLFRSQLPTYFAKESEPVVPWEFKTRLPFALLIEANRRLLKIKDILRAAVDFADLERCILGGVMGAYLNSQVSVIFDEFSENFKEFSQRDYDCLDLESSEFKRELENISIKFDDYEQRLGGVLCQALSDCPTVQHLLKVLSMFGDLLERSIIKPRIEPFYGSMLQMVGEELLHVKRIVKESMVDKSIEYDQATRKRSILTPALATGLAKIIKRPKRSSSLVMANPAQASNSVPIKRHKTPQRRPNPVHRLTAPLGCKNMPPVAGHLMWSSEIYQRLDASKAILNGIEHPIMRSKPANRMRKLIAHLQDKLLENDERVFKYWAMNIPDICEGGLSQPLLTRLQGTRLFEVNFSSKLTTTLCEVKYLLSLAGTNIPDAALRLFEHREMLRRYKLTLDALVMKHTHLRTKIASNVITLVSTDLAEVERLLQKGATKLLWSDAGAWEHITSTSDAMNDIYQRVKEAEVNLDTICKLMTTWAHAPLFQRHDGKADNLLERNGNVEKRNAEIREAGEKIFVLLETNRQLFKATTDSAAWIAYVEDVDNIITSGFVETIRCSLEYLLSETNNEKPDIQPLFEIQMDLTVSGISFVPALEQGPNSTFFDVCNAILEDVYKQADQMNRATLQDEESQTYEAQVKVNVELEELRQTFIERVETAVQEAREYNDSMERFAYLWTDDREASLKDFLSQENSKSDDLHSIPSLERFKEKIDEYEAIYSEISEMEEVVLVEPWFKINAKPFKQGLSNCVKRWSLLFKNYLIEFVTNSLSDLDEFIKNSTETLQDDPKPGDYGRLVEAMSCLGAVKARQPTTDSMFEPLKQTGDLLKSYGQEVSPETQLLIEELPRKWSNLKKRVVLMKQVVAPLQSEEVAKVRRWATEFEAVQHKYREDFLKITPFQYECEAPYTVLDKENSRISQMEEELTKLKRQAQLFEVALPEYRQLASCRREIGLLKTVWDWVFLIRSTIAGWHDTPWRLISVDEMDLTLKQFSVKDLRRLDKEVRAWPVFLGIEAEVRNMMTSLRAMNELQNPAIRGRHWSQLMSTTGVRFVMNENTVLAELLALKLHNYEEEVHTLVDKAVKEASMEKVLKELGQTWGQVSFEIEQHPRRNLKLFKVSQETVEVLEENQVQLQNMVTSKHVDFFRDQISDWQKKLTTTDYVIGLWTEVQRTWAYLEAIFLCSEDIREQLPEDSRRFDKIDEEFRRIVEDIEKRGTNIIEATHLPGVSDRLESLKERLTLCEKALADYLDTKRLAFPRFYFISPTDLLDILANGNEPIKVMPHLSKLFDSIASVDLKSNAKTAISMKAKDGEVVRLSRECSLDGKVEVWLNRLLEEMRATLLYNLHQCVSNFEEKLREQWIFDYPAQVSLAGCQIGWVAEVNLNFAQLEEGYENAMKFFNKKQITQLNALITLLVGELSPQERQKVMTICTIDVHNRDVVARLIAQKVMDHNAFEWLSQLRHRWDEEVSDCFANICDAQFRYAYEYLGNTPRLVITPLTDRCYITLTQSLHLFMSGAPAGPAGTGKFFCSFGRLCKTETTKDLGRALGIMVYVFNCSEQMDYKSIGNIYKGLAQSGSWGCFDEFNRISIDVLSVVAVQVKCIQDAIRNKCIRFNFLGEEIGLNPTVGIFITMNPGYAGRTELPENLKALFRPCAMVVPDFELICEIMLVAEGFMEARLLARKFITLYGLAKELLSKQDHYDWGLRAIKSVLVVAGSLKRGDPSRPEKEVLMRALRDFNTPKIAADDLPVFMGLITDLFPAMDVPRKRDPDFEEEVRKAAVNLKLQPEDNFILKTVQLQELLAVRHSVFILGNAGTGKSMIWRALFRTNQNLKKKPVAVDLDPKAVTNDELFGVINPATREWKDGLFSVVMRDLSRLTHDGPKWIVLDGDIDPMWIESLNTVMDDNKVLTLASNERIPLTPSMRLVFEISHLKTATPATVSRAGILFVNPQDLGWAPYAYSWLASRDNRSEQANLGLFIETYVPTCLEVLRTRFKTTVPLVELGYVQTLCNLLEVHLTPTNTPPDTPKEVYEAFFVFCAVWAFGGALVQDQLVDHRAEFSKWWIEEFKSVKFPITSGATVFDFYLDSETKKFEPWSKKVEQFILDPNEPLQTALVSTAETARIRYFLDLLVAARRPVMLVGTAGTGKTVLVQNLLRDLGEDFLVVNVPLNFYTTSEMLQQVLEKPLEKKTGRYYGPPGNKRLVYFIDDLNMPEVDAYFTVQPHTLIRQHIDHSHWYDRTKLTLKEITNAQYLTCMNPTAGSFTIDSRLQRHFVVFNISFPGREAVHSIYNSILSQHLQLPAAGFSQTVQHLASSITGLAVDFHAQVAATFLPTALKFHYIFNLRDLTNVFQGILFSKDECLKDPIDLLRLWIHETERVYADKLTDASDQTVFSKLLHDFVIKQFTELDVEESVIFAEPLLYCHFIQGFGDPRYLPVESNDTLAKLLNDALVNYNEMYAAMNLVLFEDAIEHVLRIDRILESPRGNALLVGIGGSGKQSLSRLAAFISSLEVFQIVAKKGYSVTDLKADLAALYRKAGLKNVGTVFLLTDAQVLDEKFLVTINYLLASGEIPDLFADDEVEEIISAVQSETKAAGILDTRENCWQFFINKVRRTLKVILCFSPVGPKLRMRARRFPALVNCTTIDWFHEWPEEALLSVSRRFVSEISLLDPALHEPISTFMSHVHKTVNDVSRDYLNYERRYNYTTPKSFLEQIHLYENMLNRRDKEIRGKITRLENGLQKLESTAQQVDNLKAKLATQEVELAEKNEDANKLLAIVSAETEKVVAEKAVADEEEKKVAKIRAEVSVKQRECEADLAKAEPALVAAQEALNTLNKNNLTEMKSFGTPPPAVVKVVAAVACLLAPHGRVPKDRSWKAAKAGMMSKIDQFLDNLINYDKENMHENSLKAVAEYLKDPEFDPNLVRSKSLAAAGLCSWVINIVKFHEVFCVVKPKRDALDEANKELQSATEALDKIREKIGLLESKLAELTVNFENAKAEKQRCQDEADDTMKTIDLANRLVGGLASEKLRWSQQIEEHKIQASCLPGDVLITAAFLSYVGYFTKKYRSELLDKSWMPFLNSLQPAIPMTPDLDPLSLLVDDAIVAKWNNEGLPSDRFSVENAAILTSAERWPLLVDPQLQGIKWIKTRYAEDLKVLRLGQKGYLDVIERAISEGSVVLIENIDLVIDPVLEPLIGRNTIMRGTAIRLGGKEIDYNPAFKLILQTKLGNPHYAPELQAQTTLINFTVTRDGLEDQLLANVVRKERPDLETQKSDLTRQQNEFKITLKSLEDALLAKLSEAEGNFLGNYALVENLETNKRTAAEIQGKVEQAKVTEEAINAAREIYRPACERAAILYFIVSDLNKVNPIYQFSLKAFSCVFDTAMFRAETSDDVKSRVTNIINSVTYSVYVYTSRGLFEKDKLLFTAQVAFQVCQARGEVNAQELDYLLRFPVTPNVISPVDFISNIGWGAIKALTTLEAFTNLDSDIEGSAKRWKKVVDSEKPEYERLPQDWKNKTHLQRLCILRALRPDRMLYAVRNFVSVNLGKMFVEGRSLSFAESFEESGPETPILFILSPGVDPLKDVEALGRQLGFTSDGKNFHNISLGQGQESVAEEAMKLSAQEGHWIILQNVHLVAKWLPAFEKLLEELMEGAHENYRVFISAEPASSPEFHVIPQGVLENSIKITNEPPTGMQANIHKALNNFTQATLEMSMKENEFKTILFTLCYFHAVVCERRKFGPQGWNRIYPFNNGDLTISVDVLYNYLEVNNEIPWQGLRYLFGEIMYGGHITDDWDRRLCKTYLEEYITTTMTDSDHLLAPGFKVPPNSDMAGYHKYVDDNLPPESPYLYGMHPNAEIDILTVESEKLFHRLLEMMPRESREGEQTGDCLEGSVQTKLEDILGRLPDPFNIQDLHSRVPPEERTPFAIVALQECDRMNILLREISRSLKELSLGLKGELTISPEMDALQNALFFDTVPQTWTARAYPSLHSLGLWYADLIARARDLEVWVTDFASLPSAIWLGGLFNPQSFLTAIMQQMSRKNEWPLDRVTLNVDVTRKTREELAGPPRDGAFVHSLFLEGARWDTQTGQLAEAKPKELVAALPIVFVKAIPVDKQDTRGTYACPVYKTKSRGPTYVWTFNLKTKAKPAKWVLGGAAIILQV
ncbi:unnamed protein product [Taenia asiatica]|uniref:AAA domain-containing protein n=1 Tax=Taenia asiatica TaxID=60517 RepID=A0A0R3W424_TAEAS|nr:unnamed protein product [Taenia asiatica]